MKSMKSMLILVLVVSLGIMFGGQALAKNGNGRGMGAAGTQGAQTGVCNGTGPLLNINDGEPVTFTGTVAEINLYGQGMQIDTGAELVTVYGLGPWWFWEQLGVDYPVVGDALTVNGSKVTFSDGAQKIIIVNITIGEDQVQLRDSETGAPLWPKGRSKGLISDAAELSNSGFNQDSIIIAAGRGGKGGNGSGKGGNSSGNSGNSGASGNGGTGKGNGSGSGSSGKGGNGPGDGTGNGGSKPQDGTGNGPKTGTCVNS